jgi:hypothetical protein
MFALWNISTTAAVDALAVSLHPCTQQFSPTMQVGSRSSSSGNDSATVGAAATEAMATAATPAMRPQHQRQQE